MLTFKRLNIHNLIRCLILGSLCAFFLLFLSAFFYPFAEHAQAAEIVILEGGKNNLDKTILLNTSDYEGSTEGDTPSQPVADPADQEAADEVINQINLLNEESTADDILAVIAAYDNLTPTQQAIVQGMPDIFEKLTELVDLVKAANSVINQIEILPDDSSAEDIAAARAAYDNLTPTQQAIVQKTPGILDKLESQEARIKDEEAKKAAEEKAAAEKAAAEKAAAEKAAAEKAAAEKAAAEKAAAEKAAAEKAAAEKAAAEKAAAEKEAKDQASADAVTAKINALTNKSSEKKVTAARKAYNGLTKAQKAKVSSKTLKKLTEQEARIKSEKAKKSSSSKSSSSSSSSSRKSSYKSSSSSSTSSTRSSSSNSTSSTSYTTASTSTSAATSASTQNTATDTTPAIDPSSDPSASTTDPSDYSTFDTTGTTGTDPSAISSDDVFMKLVDGAADEEEEDDEDMEEFLDEVKPNILVLPGLAAIILCGGLAGILWYRKRMDEAMGINRYQNLVEKLTAATHQVGIKGFFAKIGLAAVKAAGKVGSVLNAILGIVAAVAGKIASVLDAGFGIIAAATGKVRSVVAAGLERIAVPLKKLTAPVKTILAPLGKVTSAVGNAVSKVSPIGRRASPGSV